MSKTSILFVLLGALALSACSAHSRRVDCEGQLRPINAPAPVTTPKASPP